ncbi:kynureninase [Pontibacillus yanchengensis]|uniref:Kynureninase n=1 Tax=Pontibacillus yanchengensis Y32 TaxID=1385514 RepID=A0A0A2T536_9BACI|nr:kynureninase [Pontibacillus yanchengensis]KGP70857.1 kynureninase [Pontibacillus yanchengensis Y32]
MVNVSKEYAEELDRQDELAHFRDEFYIQPGTIYMDGNSLGLLSKRAEQALLEVLDSWKQLGINGWMQGNHPWYYLSENLGKMSAPLVGAKPEEVIVSGSTTTNLHQLVSTFYQPIGTKTKIVADELNFPSDIYALQSQLRLQGYDPNEHLVQVETRDGREINEEDIIEAMTEDVALIVLPTVLYRSGQLLDIARLTEEAQSRGIVIGFDGCHSVGAIPHKFHEWGVDFAYWCNYKYLNNGPGGVASLFVHEDHFGKTPGLAGWFGSDKEKQFDMSHTFNPAETAGAYQIGTPHVLSIAPLIGSLQLFDEASIERVRTKSLRATRYMMDLIDHELKPYGFVIGNPTEYHRRGGHVCLEHPEAARICKTLKEHGVVPDFRAPNVIRLAPVALYNTFVEVWETIQILKQVMDEAQYEKHPNERDIIA